MTVTPSSNKGRWRLWITLSELVGVLALLVAGLSFWDAHRDRVGAEKRQAAAEQAAARQAVARTSFVLTAHPEGDGARLVFQPMAPEQAIQSQRFLLPAALADHPIDSVQPRIERDWLAKGLKQAVEASRRAKTAGAAGDGETPVGVVSTYIEDGDVKTDQSIYRISYAWRTPLLGGPRFTLNGAALARRAVKGDVQRMVDAQWLAGHPETER
ncbi:hypothetical protein [Caulobacter sp. S45]|uniref:hypothetical protein n=1 Tax=Caulobacter sp. S45 TaxID=1641861 RepID=UPI00131B3368|nr:hypothetical protein [Caulobacter sp. S45]